MLTQEAGDFPYMGVHSINAMNMSHYCRHQHHYNKITIKKRWKIYVFIEIITTIFFLSKTNDTEASKNHIINLHGCDHHQHFKVFKK